MTPSSPSARSSEAVLATSNPGKLGEIREILRPLPLAILPLSDFPGVILPEEGVNYEENAIAKAKAAAHFSDRVALADDSGLEVSGLGGAPGPLSARFGGLGLGDAERVDALLDALANCTGSRRLRPQYSVSQSRPERARPVTVETAVQLSSRGWRSPMAATKGSRV